MIKEKNIVYILISSTILTLLFLGLSIYHTAVTSTIDDELSVQLTPIAPSFNEDVISQILSRRMIPPTFTVSEKAASEESSASAERALTPTESPPVAGEEVPTEEGEQR